MNTFWKSFVLLLLSASLQHSSTQVLSKQLGTFMANQFPGNLTVALGESFHIRLVTPTLQQTRCSFMAPSKRESSISNDRVQFQFTEKCSIKVLNVTNEDMGVWYLISKNSTSQIRGSTIVKVTTNFDESYIGEDIDKLQEIIPRDKNLNYCYVTKFDGISNHMRISNFNCSLPDSAEKYEDGNYVVHIGIQGQLRELTKEMKIVNNNETIQTMVDVTQTTVRLMCKIKNYRNLIKFCRFMRVEDDMGLNMLEGVSDPKYTYFGSGIEDKGECGLEVKNPDSMDKGPWKCFVGIADKCDLENNVKPDKRRFYNHSAIMDASDDPEKLRILNVNEVDVYIQDNKPAIIQCDANKVFEYCWFMHPTGRVLSVSDKRTKNESDFYEYMGDGFHLGECGIKFKSLNSADAGDWKCGVGEAQKTSAEATRSFNVKVVTNGMRTVTKQVNEYSNGPLLIECHTVPKNLPLEYCRFLTPAGFGFSINEEITSENALQDNYYFDPNRKLKDGYCAVVVKRASVAEHSGKWLCSGKPIVQSFEQFDFIDVTVDGVQTAAFSWMGVAIGLGTISVLFISFLVYRSFKKGVLGDLVIRNNLFNLMQRNSITSNPPILERRDNNPSVQERREEIEMTNINSNSNAQNTETEAESVELRPVTSSVV